MPEAARPALVGVVLWEVWSRVFAAGTLGAVVAMPCGTGAMICAMSFSDAVYSPAQRVGVTLEYAKAGVSSPEVSRRAAAGLLVDGDGRPLPAFEIPQASVRSVAKRARENGVREDGGLDVESARKLYERLARRARRLGESARTAAEVRDAGRALAEVEKLRDRLAKVPASSSESRSLRSDIMRSHRGGVWPPPVLPEPVRTPPPEPELVTVEPSPAEWIRQQVVSLGPAAATPKPSERRTGRGTPDETVQSRPDAAARDVPLPEIRARRRERRSAADASA